MTDKRKLSKALKSFNEEFTAEQVVQWAAATFGDGLVLQTSGGIQANVMLSLVSRAIPNVKVVFVDTGYLPKETTDYMEELRQELNLNLTIGRPVLSPEELERQHGKLWETDHELYGKLTKVDPMDNALRDLGATCILSGLRSQQTDTRAGMTKLTYDMDSKLFKVLPILAWTKQDVTDYQKEMNLPKHPLQLKGFTTVGDAHSSRATKAGENDRATRFGGKSQECGLHTRPSLSGASLLACFQDLPGFQALPDGYIIFTKPDCKFCKAAKALLHDRGMTYLEKDITDDLISAEMYRNAPDAKTVPQIFLDNSHIGGFTELHSKLGVQGNVEDYVKAFLPKKLGSMEEIELTFANRAKVPLFLGSETQEQILAHILELNADKVLLVTEQGVDAMHGNYFAPLGLETTGGCPDCGTGEAPMETSEKDQSSSKLGSSLPEVKKIVLPSGDEAKSWEHLTQLLEWNFAVGATKRSVVVAFGGGALLNVAGLFASIAFRGMKLVYVPTTLLAMHDVVTSLKTSVSMDGRKNNVGSFYAPLKVLVDVAFCRTLTKHELMSGLGELAKNACLFGGVYAEGFTAALNAEVINNQNGGSGEEFSFDDKVMLNLTRLGIQAKLDIIKTDACEHTDGMALEYGHTMSHALEKSYGDCVIPHGLGVVYGMLSSSMAAEELGFMSSQARTKHDEICNLIADRWPLPEPKPSIETVMDRLMRDSKRGIAEEDVHELSDVLLHDVGDVVQAGQSNLSRIPRELTESWLRSMGFPDEGFPELKEKHTFSKCKRLGESESESESFSELPQSFKRLRIDEVPESFKSFSKFDKADQTHLGSSYSPGIANAYWQTRIGKQVRHIGKRVSGYIGDSTGESPMS